jgi:phospholipase/carboxylesterase
MSDCSDPGITRRHFAAAGGSTFLSLLFGATCGATSAAQASAARLTPRPRANAATSLASGALGVGRGQRDGVIQVPSTNRDGPLPLLVFLHGATQNGAGILRRIGPAADALGIVVLAPDSRGRTWDAITDGFGEDVTFLNRSLEFVLDRLPVDPARLAVGGFSDGASYALSLGLANGDLFPRVVACSPGFVMSAPPQGWPRVFVSHGIADQILPIDRCSRIIVPRLRMLKYDVTYREFEGRHEMPADVLAEALRWMTA